MLLLLEAFVVYRFRSRRRGGHNFTNLKIRLQSKLSIEDHFFRQELGLHL